MDYRRRPVRIFERRSTIGTTGRNQRGVELDRDTAVFLHMDIGQVAGIVCTLDPESMHDRLFRMDMTTGALESRVSAIRLLVEMDAVPTRRQAARLDPKQRAFGRIGKASAVSADQLATVKKLIASLNADARILTCDHGRVPLDAILDTGLFDEEKAAQHPLWAKELYGYASHQPETEEYGIESFVYRARAPFDAAKLHAFLVTDGLDNVVRAKGHFWLATRPEWVGELAVAGSQTMTSRMGCWWASIPKNQWPDDDRFERFVAAHWDNVWGDRRQELVFIGIGMDEARIRPRLDECLMPVRTFTPELWMGLRDPFPSWTPAEAEAA